MDPQPKCERCGVALTFASAVQVGRRCLPCLQAEDPNTAKKLMEPATDPYHYDRSTLNDGFDLGPFSFKGETARGLLASASLVIPLLVTLLMVFVFDAGRDITILVAVLLCLFLEAKCRQYRDDHWHGLW